MSAAPAIHAPFETDDVLREMYRGHVRRLLAVRHDPAFRRLARQTIRERITQLRLMEWRS